MQMLGNISYKGSSKTTYLRISAPTAPKLLRSARKMSNKRLKVAAAGKSTVSALAADETKLRTYRLTDMTESERDEIMSRPRIDFTSIMDIVGPICESVRTRGDDAVREFTEKFDGVAPELIVENLEDIPMPELPKEVSDAFDVAFDNIQKFHTAQKMTAPLSVETMPGVVCRRIAKPIGAVGLYVPGGTAVLPSTALMLAVPAGIAGCGTIVLATPPRKDGSISPEVLYCAKKAGVTHLLKAGGAQAVAAMGYGTASCPKVDKIFGPGNQFVTAAKMLLTNSEAMVSIDMPAGPSEVLVIADAEAPVSFVASDLLSQAEHGKDSQVVLVAMPGVDIEALQAEVQRQCAELPRAETARAALAHSFVVQVESKEEACAFSNLYAPEHLIVNVEDAESWLPHFDNAGSIFLGRWTPESVGDYASGTNHVLPTYGYAKMYSGVSLESFQKNITVQALTKEGLQLLGPSVALMADIEELTAHQRAVTLRLKHDP